MVTGAKLEIALSPTEMTDFLGALLSDFASVNRMIAAVDSRRSEAWNPVDKERFVA